ncbi:MAG: MerR family transcriptional regulator [Nitrospirae bacterium]|nr:MerR family transcriptional regulator [Nitrospirota bacterium]MBI3805756.1 MerR family transcriptional regulator [Candidatus Manganitrophaceae bacterium]
MELPIPHRFGPKEICRRLNLSHRQLDYWVLIGVVRPILEPHGKKVFKKFTDQDFYFLREVKALTDEGFIVSKAAEKVRENWSRRMESHGKEGTAE